jgi:hypothetical protein
MAFALGCNSGATGAPGADGQSATVTAEPAGANCATGGIKVQVGTGTPTYVCNGAAGADGRAAEVTAEPAGANCATGGVKVQVGTGAPTYVCNGSSGTAGADGKSTVVTLEPAGANCADGGLKIQVGSGTPAYVCNGEDGAAGTPGTDGKSATVTPEPAGTNCAAGGLRVQVGGGTPAYVCNGKDGTDGESATVTTEPAGTNCAAGGLKVQVGSKTPAYVCNPVPAACSGNHAPVISGVTVSPDPLSLGGTATVVVSATDADGDTLTYSIAGSGGTFTGGTDGSFSFTPTADGVTTFTAFVTDGCQIAMASFTVITGFGFTDGVFQTGAAWTTAGGASLTPASAGNGNAGSALVPCGVSASVSQAVTVLPKSLRVRAGFDARAHCAPPSAPSCMMGIGPSPALLAGGVVEVRGFTGIPDMWSSSASCLGEAAYGSGVAFSLADMASGDSSWTLEFDNAHMEVVDDHTCPAIGTVLNGDMQGNFGWAPCGAGSGVISYAVDSGAPYVKVSATGSCGDITCLSSWISAPLLATMAHPALKFDYESGGKSSGGYNFIVTTEFGEIEIQQYDSATWQSVTACIPASVRGRAETIQFSRGACWAADPDWIELKNVRIENDATACP